MSSLTNTAIFEDIADKWDIVKCTNGVGVFELTYEESIQETHSTPKMNVGTSLSTQFTMKLIQGVSETVENCDSLYTDHTPPNLPF